MELASAQPVLLHISAADAGSILAMLIHLIVFSVKTGFFLFVYVWVRWTLPRFRYDQLMDLGWKTLLPWSLANLAVTATVMFFATGAP